MKLSITADSWILLMIAIVFGVLGTTSMKLSHGLENHKHVVNFIIFYAISFIALTFAIQHIELSVVYAVWSGVGTLLITLIGIFHFHESVSLKKIIYLSLIVLGVIGIHITDGFS